MPALRKIIASSATQLARKQSIESPGGASTLHVAQLGGPMF
jgi:hypothetical protein